MNTVATNICRFISSFLLVVVLFLMTVMTTNAANITNVEQQINIIDQEYSIGSTTFSPTDNSLGLIYWDQDVYNDATVYFEAVVRCNSCNGGNGRMQVALYNDAGTVVANSTINQTSSTYSRIRSTAITANITDDDEYTVRIRRDANNGTAFIQSARLIIVQSGSAITATQTQVEIGNNTTTTDTSYTLMTGPKIYYFDTNNISDKTGIYFEATIRGSAAEATAYASLSSSSTCATTVSGSEVTTTGTSYLRIRSADIQANLTDDTGYWVCIRTSASHTASINNAKFIINQASATSISAIETFQQYINRPMTDTDSTYTSVIQDNEYNPANFVADIEQYYFETTMQTNAGTAFARLFNVTDVINVTNAERITTATSYTRVRSPDIADTMPSTTKTLDTQLRNSATNTTTASTSWLIIRLQEEPSLTFTVSAVAAGQVNNEITTSVASTYASLPFSNLTNGTPKYAAHALYVKTNALHGYTVQAKLENYLQGINPANNIDSFIALWSSPTTWTEPTGTTQNIDTGWIGANTTDTRVPNWTSGTAQKFGALDSTLRTVMQSSTADSGTTHYVTYAIEVNISQPTDLYSGTLLYDILPIY